LRCRTKRRRLLINIE